MNDEQNAEPKELYTPDELRNIFRMIEVLDTLRQELLDEGIPIDEYERILIDSDEMVE